MNFIPEAIHIEKGAEGFALTQKTVDRFPNAPVYENADVGRLTEELRQTHSDVFGAGKKHLVLSRFPGSFLKKCPGISKGMVCCNYYVVNLIKNCIYDCTYCFLQDFLENNPVMTAYVNIDDLLGELDDVFRANPDRAYRVGTGELTDSLALEAAVPYSDYLIPFFQSHDNAVLELKTKSDEVENLIRRGGSEKVIVSWSINPQEIVEREEKGTASLDQRLQAARRCREAGFRVGFHFDPIVIYPGWEEAYEKTIQSLFAHVPPDAIEWISLGSFRYRPNLKKIINQRSRSNLLFASEHVACEDGKFRYLRPLRTHAYETLRARLKRESPDLNVYLCMETKEIWEGTTGKLPRSDKKLDQFFDL